MEDCEDLQLDLDRINEWSKRWDMDFNMSKCHVIEFGRSKYRPSFEYKMGDRVIEKSVEEEDLGICFQESLSPELHINRKVRNTLGILSDVRINFAYIDAEMMSKIIKSIIRPKLEYAQVVWAPHLINHSKKIERVQRTATRMIPELENLEYEDRLKRLGLESLEDRRTRGDLIQLFKFVRGFDETDIQNWIVVDNLKMTRRAHDYKLRFLTCDSDLKRTAFPNRVIQMWNRLPERVVCANSISKFKEEYDVYSKESGTPRA